MVDDPLLASNPVLADGNYIFNDYRPNQIFVFLQSLKKEVDWGGGLPEEKCTGESHTNYPRQPQNSVSESFKCTLLFLCTYFLRLCTYKENRYDSY